MLITKKEKEFVYNEMFRVGILVINKNKKNFSTKEKEIRGFVIIKLLKGLLSKGLVKETFSWKFYYFTLNDKGVEFLRNFLNLPSTVIPLIYKNPTISTK